MKGDFSRIRFNPARQYTSVLKQQGRVDLDADSNEQRFIDERMRETINTDVIGPCGAPENDAGFAIEISGNEILIGPGRFYVDGILVENPSTIHYDKQPWLIDPSSTASDLLDQLLNGGQTGCLSFVLEVWQRMVTALDDRCLIEPALDRADTTARLQTVWRVIGAYDSGNSESTPSHESSLSFANTLGTIDYNTAPSPSNSPIDQLSPCCQALYDDRLRFKLRGEMGADVGTGGSACGCQPIPVAGYQGLENQLYRVEIHQAGDLSSATFKWSRENASVVSKITNVAANVVTVASLGPDANLGFQPDRWVELSDDISEFGDTPNQPGSLFKIVSIDPTSLQVTVDNPVYGIDHRRNARMRRWDQPITTGTSAGIPVSETPVPLENGIEVSFRSGEFQSGDYWTIPARTANGEIDWPPCGKPRTHFQKPDFIQIHRAPVACVNLRSRIDYIYRKGITGTAQDRTQVNDCRLLFPPLTWVNANTVPQALHVTAASWNNDDIMTIDTLLANGLSVTFDQPTTCPWGGGNFEVTFEAPYSPGDALALFEGKLPGITKPTFPSPPGTDCFLRTMVALDPPWGITVSGNTVSWITPVSSSGKVNYGAYEVMLAFNVMLGWTNPIGFGRLRVRLIGGAVYGSGNNGNIYLDGQSLGDTSTRSLDGSECVSLTTPSGDNAAVSDYESWFYIAPTVYITSVIIQGLDGNNKVVKSPLTAAKVIVNSQNQVTKLQVGETQTISVESVQALITLSYPPVSPITVNLSFSGPGTGSVISVGSSIQIAAGQQTAIAAIHILSNPGAGVKDTVTLNASVPLLESSYPVQTAPTLTISGSTPPGAQTPAPPPPAPPPATPSPISGKVKKVKLP